MEDNEKSELDKIIFEEQEKMGMDPTETLDKIILGEKIKMALKK